MIVAASLALMAVTIIATPWLVAKLPTDYWQARRAEVSRISATRLIFGICRGLLGGLIMLAGLVMMVTPGPGLLMLLLGISVAEFPGKHRLLVYLATRPRVFASLNWMRQRAGREPFTHPAKNIPQSPD